jgi:hypothetical protein
MVRDCSFWRIGQDYMHHVQSKRTLQRVNSNLLAVLLFLRGPLVLFTQVPLRGVLLQVRLLLDWSRQRLRHAVWRWIRYLPPRMDLRTKIQGQKMSSSLDHGERCCQEPLRPSCETWLSTVDNSDTILWLCVSYEKCYVSFNSNLAEMSALCKAHLGRFVEATNVGQML